MLLRTLFRVHQVTTSIHSVGCEVDQDGKEDYSKPIYEQRQSVTLLPVHTEDDKVADNHRVWKDSPSGSIELKGLKADVVEIFSVGGLYAVDFNLMD